jgi:hypothetical protein
MRWSSIALVATSLASMLVAAPALAAAGRTFVSAAGNDSNPCTITLPCRNLQAAYNAVAPNGEVEALDPGNYGSLTITGPVTIQGHGWAGMSTTTGAAITINAAGATDKINIFGVVADGLGISGTNGIVFNSGGSLTVTNCVLQNFITVSETTGIGILIQPTTGLLNFAITNTTASNNQRGIVYEPQSGSAITHGVIDHAGTNGNQQEGITVLTSMASGGTTVVIIANSIATNNGSDGILIENQSAPSPITASIDNANVSNNAGGITAIGTPNVLLGRSVISANSLTGVLNDTVPNTFYTYGDNRINLNNPDEENALNPAFTPK